MIKNSKSSEKRKKSSRMRSDESLFQNKIFIRLDWSKSVKKWCWINLVYWFIRLFEKFEVSNVLVGFRTAVNIQNCQIFKTIVLIDMLEAYPCLKDDFHNDYTWGDKKKLPLSSRIFTNLLVFPQFGFSSSESKSSFNTIAIASLLTAMLKL